MSCDHILLIGFGGPRAPEEVEPFLREVTRGRKIPEARLREVLHHYERIGGKSPYNEQVLRFKEKWAEHLKENGADLPVFVGMRNWHPFVKETLAEIRQRGFRRGIGVVLAPHRSEASFERYVKSVEEAREPSLLYSYAGPWHQHPLFVEAQTEQVRKIYDTLSPEIQRSLRLFFSAHSIPLEMARRSRYEEEVKTSSRLVAEALRHSKWKVVYQSRSGNPEEPWLGPDLLSVIRQIDVRGTPAVLVVPIGFLCENAEILFDLDVEARETAERRGLHYFRAATVLGHPKTLELFTALVKDASQSRGVTRDEPVRRESPSPSESSAGQSQSLLGSGACASGREPRR